jgi:DNA-binding transcriptional regulator/RsmH inhibitor MraZ
MLVWDAQGRIRIGENLLAHVEVQSQVVLVGALTRIELWSVENFDLALPQDSSTADDLFFGGY